MENQKKQFDPAELYDETLIYLIGHYRDFTWNFMAMKYILMRLKMNIEANPDNKSIPEQCCRELRDFFRKYTRIRKVQNDLQQIHSLNVLFKHNDQ
jgi:hypothetical protein